MDETPLRMLRFSTDDFPENKRIESYKEIFGRTIIKHDIDPIGEQPFQFKSTLCSLPGLGLASSVISPCRRVHTRQHVQSDDFILGVSLGGGCIVEQRGREAVIGLREAILTTGADPADIVIPSTSRPVSFRIPNSVLRSRIAGVDNLVSRQLRCDPAALKLLIGYVDAIRSAEMLARLELRNIVVTHIYDLVSLALGAVGETRQAAEEGGARVARRSAILSNIDRLSSDPALTANVVADLLGITPRYVHLILEETGRSFGEHVLERRLEKAAALLRDPSWRNRKIVDIAAEAGFTNLSYFNRCFRRRFGDTPSGARGSDQD